MRICLLTTQDLDADPFPEDDWPCDPRPFLPEADWHVATLEGKEASVHEVERLIASDRFDLFFNLCDGAADQDIPGIEVVQALAEVRRLRWLQGSALTVPRLTRAQIRRRFSAQESRGRH